MLFLITLFLPPESIFYFVMFSENGRHFLMHQDPFVQWTHDQRSGPTELNQLQGVGNAPRYDNLFLLQKFNLAL